MVIAMLFSSNMYSIPTLLNLNIELQRETIMTISFHIITALKNAFITDTMYIQYNDQSTLTSCTQNILDSENG